MRRTRRIFIVSDTKEYSERLLIDGVRRLVKGFVRIGCDAQVFGFNDALQMLSPIKSRKWSGRLYKSAVDELVVGQLKNYQPDVVCVCFPKFMDSTTVSMMRQACPGSFFIGSIGDLWPHLHKNWLEIAAALDTVMTTYDGSGLTELKKAGARCVFMPNSCDPDIECRYEVSSEWKSDILFTGQAAYKRYPTDNMRSEIISRLSDMPDCSLYGCFGRPFLSGIQYYYAISGAKIGLAINADNNIRLYHSDRLTQYISCGTFVLAKRVPDTDLLFKDKVHLRYFDSAEEFFELARWYLLHEEERLRLADAGMQWAHREFNCQKMAEYTIDIIEKGTYQSPWTGVL